DGGGIALLSLKGACPRPWRTVQLRVTPASPKTCRGQTMSQLPRHALAGGGIALLSLKGACPRPWRTVQLRVTPASPKTCRGKTMSQLPRHALAGAASLVVAITLATSVSAQKADKDAKDNQDAK